MDKYFDIKRVQVEMIRDRGYIIPDEEKIFLDENFDENMFGEYLKDIDANIEARVFNSAYSSKDKKETIYIYYSSGGDNRETSTGVQIIKNFKEETKNYTKAILIAGPKLSPDASKNLADDPKKYQTFYESELTYNPTQRIDYQPHILVPENEAETLLKEIKVNRSQLTILRKTDPTVRYFGWENRNIIKILRNDDYISVLSPKSLNYRIIAL